MNCLNTLPLSANSKSIRTSVRGMPGEVFLPFTTGSLVTTTLGKSQPLVLATTSFMGIHEDQVPMGICTVLSELTNSPRTTRPPKPSPPLRQTTLTLFCSGSDLATRTRIASLAITVEPFPVGSDLSTCSWESKGVTRNNIKTNSEGFIDTTHLKND